MNRNSKPKNTENKERFLAHMSHEIRTRMNTVIGMAHLLQKANPNPEQREYLEALQSASNSLLGILNNILDFSKIEAGMIEFEKVEFRLAEILENVKQTIQPRAQEKKLAFLISLNDRIPAALIGDPVRLNQILMNLVDNAIKFTEKGAVLVQVELLEEDDRSFKLLFSVRDNGIGIPANKLNRIFEDFTQASPEIMRKYGGTGLGLTIVKQLVEMQGGSISVESQVDKGSTFCFILRFEKVVTSSIQSGQTTAVNEPALRLEGLRILLVEDDKLSQRVAAIMLGKWGATVEIAENGRMAIQKLTTNFYDIVLMDVITPEMDGYETTSYIRNEMNGTINRIPILAMTASASVNAREKVLACGMNDYITKPFEPDNLCTKIIRLINKQKSSIE